VATCPTGYVCQNYPPGSPNQFCLQNCTTSADCPPGYPYCEVGTSPTPWCD
jgi:hypothetical protein